MFMCIRRGSTVPNEFTELLLGLEGPALTVCPLSMRGTPGEVGVDGFPWRRLQFRIGPIDVDREALLQVLQSQLHRVLGFQML